MKTLAQTMRELGALIDRAEREKLWLFCHYQDLWFSPGELRAANDKGRFRWDAGNFQLRDPSIRLAQLHAAVVQAGQDYDDFQERVAKWRAE